MNSDVLGVEQKSLSLSHFRPGHILLNPIDFLHTARCIRRLLDSLHWCEGRFQLLLSRKGRVEHLSPLGDQI